MTKIGFDVFKTQAWRIKFEYSRQTNLKLNNNFQDSNLTNFGPNKFARDYDKEPIILKNYEEAYQLEVLRFLLRGLENVS